MGGELATFPAATALDQRYPPQTVSTKIGSIIYFVLVLDSLTDLIYFGPRPAVNWVRGLVTRPPLTRLRILMDTDE